MGMSTSVIGVREFDGKFAKMLAAKLACDEAEITYPPAILEYFGGAAGESVDYLRREMEEIDVKAAVTQGSENSADWIEVELSKLPFDIRAIRFRNSY
jgi:hypothetical protein